MMTLRALGRSPRISLSSSTVLILCWYFSVSDDSMLDYPRPMNSNHVLVAVAIDRGSHSGASFQ